MKQFYFAAAIAAMVFTACATGEETVQPVPEKAAIHFSGVNAIDVVTRADDPTAFTDDFNIFVTNGITAAPKVVTFTTSWGFKDGVDVYVDRTGGTLVAWAPQTLTGVTASGNSVTYTLTAQKDAADKDLIYEKQAVDASNATTIAVNMGHAYSKLSFKAAKGNGYNGAASLTGVEINSGIYATGTLDMVNGGLPTVAGEANGTLTLAAGEKALVVPVTGTPTIAVTCTIDAQTYTKDIAMPSLTAGTEYEITLTVVGETAVISSVKQVPWTTTAVDGGEIK